MKATRFCRNSDVRIVSVWFILVKRAVEELKSVK